MSSRRKPTVQQARQRARQMAGAAVQHAMDIVTMAEQGQQMGEAVVARLPRATIERAEGTLSAAGVQKAGTWADTLANLNAGRG